MAKLKDEPVFTRRAVKYKTGKSPSLFVFGTCLYLQLILFQLLCFSSSTFGFDLISTLMSQSPSMPNIKSLVSSDMLSKMKGLLPSLPSGQSHDPKDVAQIEKLLAKMKPAEGRFDPQLMELLAHFDASQRAKHHPRPNPNPHQHQHEHEHEDENGHYSDEQNPSSTPSDPIIFSTTDGKPKFSSKFRLDEAIEPNEEHFNQNHDQHQNQHQQNQEEKGSHLLDLDLNHVIDPNIRNHRLYELDQDRFDNDQGRYETYENFTALDQIEDLQAEESGGGHGGGLEVIVPPPSDMKVRRKSPLPASTPSSNNGWIGRPYTTLRRSSPKPKSKPVSNSNSEPGPTTFSYEIDAVSMDTSIGDDEYSSASSSSSQIAHDREPLKHSSTEKTVIYPQNYHYHSRPGHRQSQSQSSSPRPQYRRKMKPNEQNKNEYTTTTQAESYEKSTENEHLHAESSSTKNIRFKPSPVDLSPPMIFEPDQDFYTATISKNQNHKANNNNKSGRRRQPHHHNRNHHHNQNHNHEEEEDEDVDADDDDNDNEALYATEKSSQVYPPPPFDNPYASTTDLNVYSDQPDYPKEQPSYHNAMNYIKSNNNNNNHNPHAHPHPQMMEPNPQLMNHNHNLPTVPMNTKQDRILPGLHQVQQHISNIPSMFYSAMNSVGVGGSAGSGGGGGGGSAMRNGYVAQPSENVYHDVAMNPYRTQLQSPSYQHQQQQQYHSGYQQQPQHQQQPQQQHDLEYSAGQNYYGHHPAHSHGHYDDGSSSWTSTFFLLGGLIALSAVIAFLLPSILTGGGVTAGKDDKTGLIDDGEVETDLWTEIKGLYTDIVNIAKGDYTNFNRQRVNRHRNDLVNIKYEDDNENENEEDDADIDEDDYGHGHGNGNGNRGKIQKRRGQAGQLADKNGNRNKNNNRNNRNGNREEEEEIDDDDNVTEESQEGREETTTFPSSSPSPSSSSSSTTSSSRKHHDDHQLKEEKPEEETHSDSLERIDEDQEKLSHPDNIQIDKTDTEATKTRPSRENINDSLAFGVLTSINQTHGGMNFANAFNQTLQAWEKVPLIAN